MVSWHQSPESARPGTRDEYAAEKRGMSTERAALRGHVIDRVLTTARREFDFDLVYLSEFRGAAMHLVALSGAAERFGLAPRMAVPLTRSFCLDMVQGRIAQVVNDTSGDRRARRLQREAGITIGAYAGVPVYLADGRLFGSLCGVAAEPRPALSAADADYLRVLADVVTEELTPSTDDGGTGAALEAILAGNAVVTVFQPIVDLRDGTTYGVEALSRFPGAMELPTELWFTEAARIGRDLELESACLATALAQADDLDPTWRLSVNVSPGSVLAGGADPVLDVSSPDRIVLELTEHAAVEDYEALNLELDRFRDAGVSICVDDAGAGFASLRHVLQLRPDVVKVDGTLTRHVGQEPFTDALVNALTAFAADTGAALVAEKIETSQAMHSLRTRGVRLGQGFLFAKPGSHEELRSSYPVPPA